MNNCNLAKSKIILFLFINILASCGERLLNTPQRRGVNEKDPTIVEGTPEDKNNSKASASNIPELVDPPELRAAFLKVISDNCVTCHQEGKSASFANFAKLKTGKEWVAAGYIKPLNVGGSSIYFRSRGSKGELGPKTMPPTGQDLSSAELGAIQSYISALKNVVIVKAAPLQFGGFECSVNSNQSAGPAKLRRLSKSQYKNTLSDILAPMPSVDYTATLALVDSAMAFLPEDSSNGQDLNKTIFTNMDSRLSNMHFGSYVQVAEAIANKINSLTSLKRVYMNGCAPTTSVINAACIASFVDDFGLRTQRRPFQDASERQRMITISSTNVYGLCAPHSIIPPVCHCLYSKQHTGGSRLWILSH